jgi:hypothetical protein
MLDRNKYGHIKSRLDECKKFDEECKLRYIADRMIELYKKLRCQTCTKKENKVPFFVKVRTGPGFL